jgi:hypothetical protein
LTGKVTACKQWTLNRWFTASKNHRWLQTRRKESSTYRFLRVVMLVRTFGNGPDNRFPITELHRYIRKVWNFTLTIYIELRKEMRWGCGRCPYNSSNRKVPHWGGITPVKRLRLRSLLDNWVHNQQQQFSITKTSEMFDLFLTVV